MYLLEYKMSLKDREFYFWDKIMYIYFLTKLSCTSVRFKYKLIKNNFFIRHSWSTRLLWLNDPVEKKLSFNPTVGVKSYGRTAFLLVSSVIYVKLGGYLAKPC